MSQLYVCTGCVALPWLPVYPFFLSLHKILVCCVTCCGPPNFVLTMPPRALSFSTNLASDMDRLAAETLAGLNNMHQKSSPDATKLASSLDHVDNDSPAAARKLSKQLGDANRRQRRKLAQVQKAPTPAAITTAAAVHASGGSASVHPILGFSVPHARRSYRTDVTPTPAKSGPSAHSTASDAKHASGELRGSELRGSELRGSALTPVNGQQRKPGAMPPQARPSFSKIEMPRAASDSSMTVSADST